MRKKYILVIAAWFLFQPAFGQIKWPAVSKQTKPWTRWWWEGSAVNKKDLAWNLQQYQQAGLGGVELTPIYGAQGYESQFINFLSPKWMEMFSYTLTEAKKLGIGVDLANATGWPFGGPWVRDDDASRSIYYKIFVLKAGEQLKQPVEYKQTALVRTANNKPVAIDSLVQPVSANTNLQGLALDQIQYPGNLPLQSLIAYSDKKEIIDLTGKVNSDLQLDWVAPAGNWTLYAIFSGLHGKMVERAAPGGEGYAIDHFSEKAARNYFKKFDAAFTGNNISYLRSFFNDSYEVDDASGQANWTPDFFTEFKKSRGYDLRMELPALFGKDEADKNTRVIYDYRAVIDELLLKNFTITWKKWAASKGKLVRNQSHGSPANTLDLYSVVDIPETEGTDILRFKFATSAANVSGKKLVSSESATWLNEHFLSSWGDVKKAIDLYFLGGVNHIFYHGTAYSPKDAPWPGWLFYAAVHFQPTNPQWKDFHALNSYITRAQSFLQSGRPDNDVLLYYPIIDRYSEPGNALLQHFDGMERNFEKTDFEYVSKWMLEHGYSFDFFSDRQSKGFTNSGNKIMSGGNSYRTILLPANMLINDFTIQNLFHLATAGATILFYKTLPQDVPGLGNLEDRQKNFASLMNSLDFKNENGIKKAVIGKGTFIVSDELEKLMEAGNVRQEQLAAKELAGIRRKINNEICYFINNRNETAFDGWVEISEKSSSIVLFDPMTGQMGLANKKTNKNGFTEVQIQLQSFESIIVQTYHSAISGPRFPYKDRLGAPQEIKTNWTIEFLDGGPKLPAKNIFSKLYSWTELSDNDAKNFSGTAKYTTSFQKPAGNGSSWILNLGKVNESADVFLNGKKIETLIGPVFQCSIPTAAFRQENKLEIIVASLMANRIIFMDRNNLPWKIFYNTNMPARRRENSKNGIFDASSWKPLPSGLLGPVTLTEAGVIK